MRLRLAAALVVAVGLGATGTASASSIVYVCGDDLCRVDPRKPTKVKRLTRDGGDGKDHYASPSLSRSGTRLSFLRGTSLYIANRAAQERRKRAEGVTFAWLKPDATELVMVKSLYTLIVPGIFFPCCTPAVYGFRPHLMHVPATGGTERIHSIGTITAGWLRDRYVFAADGEADQPDYICLAAPIEADTTCERPVAQDPGRALSGPAGSQDGRYVAAVAEPYTPGGDFDQKFAGSIALFDAASGALLRNLTTGPRDSAPAFSPDGRQLVFTRDRRLYVVNTKGGPAKSLRLRGDSPTWGAS